MVKKRAGPKVIVVANMKGGVGKTLISVNLASYLSEKYKVLLIDADFQANASHYLGVKTAGIESNRSLFDGIVTEEKSLKDVIIPSIFKNLDVVTAREDLYEFDMKVNIDTTLASWMNKPALNRYDFVIFDSRPDISKLLFNILFATDFVLIPISPDPDALSGLKIILKHLNRIQKSKSDLRLLGVVISNYDKDAPTHVKKYIPYYEKVLGGLNIPILGKISRSKAVVNSVDQFMPLNYYLPKNKKMPIKTDFKKLAENVAKMAKFTIGRVPKIPILTTGESEKSYMKMTGNSEKIQEENLYHLEEEYE